MFKLQLLIDGQAVGQPMEVVEAQKWQSFLKVNFPTNVIRWRKIT